MKTLDSLLGHKGLSNNTSQNVSCRINPFPFVSDVVVPGCQREFIVQLQQRLIPPGLAVTWVC